MEEILYTFEPVHSRDELNFWIALVLALAALAGMGLLLRKKAPAGQRNRYLLGAMLLFFVFLIAGSTAFFSNLFMRKVGPVRLTRSTIETPFGKAAYTDILRAYIHTDQQPSLIDPGVSRRTTQMLIIEERNGDTHVLSEENYPIREILGRMRELTK